MKLSLRSLTPLLLVGASLFLHSSTTALAAETPSPEAPAPSQQYSWRLQPNVKTFQFDVANAVKEPGTYLATWQWKRGDHALKINSVALYQGEEKVSEDVHVGETGINNIDNVYALELPKAATNTEPYTLRAQVEGIGGTSSFGIVTLRKAVPGEITKEYAWQLKPDVTTLEFDVATTVTAAGTYLATFQWQRGNNALKINSVALHEGDKKVAEDVHEGWTGYENRNNSYTLELPTYRTGHETYTLRAQIEGAAGTDSSGILTLAKTK